MTDSTDTQQNKRPELPEWVNPDFLPFADEESVAKRIRLGVRGIALANLLAYWTTEVVPLNVDLDLGFDLGDLRDAIEERLGFDRINRARNLISDIDSMLDGRADDAARLEDWVASHPEVFANPSVEVLIYGTEQAQEAIESAGGVVTWPNREANSDD